MADKGALLVLASYGRVDGLGYARDSDRNSNYGNSPIARAPRPPTKCRSLALDLRQRPPYIHGLANQPPSAKNRKCPEERGYGQASSLHSVLKIRRYTCTRVCVPSYLIFCPNFYFSDPQGVSLIAGLDSPLERGTGMWDWNMGLECMHVGQESLIAIVGHTIH